ncbi:MAG: FAD-binding oxidoreductase [Woeseiaceae bacterium]|nr:FAD-binding oxidoreductase [Woeseiaceae bacterium]
MEGSMDFAQEHTGSYYAATVNEVTDYPRLKEDIRADVCVVGGGFTGISTALSLAERSYKVCVLEANRIGWGASGRNGGQMIGGLSGTARLEKKNPAHADMIWDMGWRGHEIIRDRVERYDIDCDLKHGYVDVALKERHLRDFEAANEELARRNYPFEHRMMSRDETCDALGTEHYIGALLNMGNGHLHPLNLCIGEAKAAESLGAVLHEQSAALKIEHGDAVRISTAEGSVTADFVLLAGNAYQFLDQQLRSRFLPVRSYIVATEPLSDDQVDSINPHDLAVCDPNFLLEYFRLSADKRLLFGNRFRYFGDERDVIAANHRPKLERTYPQLKGIKIDYGWGGTIAVTINRVAQLGRIAPNVLYSNAYSGHGVNVTHLCGEIIADTIGGTLERFDVMSSVPAARIPGINILGNTLVNLGVLWYGLQDRL